MKKLSFALAAIGLSSSIFAALPAATDPTIVNIPELDGGFVIGLMGDYLQPSPSNGDLDFFNPTTFGGGPSFSSKFYGVDPSYQWGWGANIGYVFPQTGNDINLSYSHLGTSDSHTLAPSELAALGGTTLIGPLIILTNTYFAAAPTAQYNLNQVDLTAGQLIDVGCRLRLHPNMGMRWASIDHKLNMNLGLAQTFVFSPTGTVLATTHNEIYFGNKSYFDGIGPLAGLDATYYIGRGFGAVAHADSALLIGDVNNKLINPTKANVTNLDTSEVALFTVTDTIDSNRRMVPIVDAKLGLDYTYLFNNVKKSDLTLEAGWQTSQYYNAVDRIAATPFGYFLTAVGTPIIGFTPIHIIERITSRVGFNGPYATLVLHV
jgi:hypothetical protein